MATTYREISGHPNLFEAHNPGRPIWLIILCKVISALNALLCENESMKD